MNELEESLSREALRRLRGVSIRQLVYLIELTKKKNFRKAAAVLAVAQPTLSQQMKQLEETLGLSLLDREKRGFALTEEGETIVAAATRALGHLGCGIDQILAEQAKPALRVGLPAYLSYPIVTDVMRQFRALHPNISPQYVELPADEMAESLTSDKLDLAFLSLPAPIKFSQPVRQKLVWSGTYHLCLSKKHSAARKAILTGEDCKDLEFIMLPRHVHEAHYDHQYDMLRTLCGAPKIFHTEVVHAQAQIELARAGLGAALICPGTVKLDDDAVLLPTSPPLGQSNISAFWNSRNFNPLLNRFLTAMDKTTKQAGANTGAQS